MTNIELFEVMKAITFLLGLFSITLLLMFPDRRQSNRWSDPIIVLKGVLLLLLIACLALYYICAGTIVRRGGSISPTIEKIE